MKLARIFTIGIAVIAAGPSVASGPSCRYAPDIAAFADIALTNLDQYGSSNSISPTEFAYLKIKYGALERPKALELLTTLSRQRNFDPLAAEDLRLSVGSADDRLAFLRASNESNRNLLLTSSVSLVRSFIKDGNLESYLKALQENMAKPDEAWKIAVLIAIAGTSLPDTQKDSVAKMFAGLDDPALAALILASKVDIRDWIAFRKEHPIRGAAPDSLFKAFIADSGPRVRREGLGGLGRILAIPPAKDEWDAYERAKSQIQRVDPLGDWLKLLAVRDFDAAPLTGLFARIDREEVNPRNSDELAIATVSALDRSWGKAGREQKLGRSSISLPILSLMTNRFPAALFFDTAIARQALQPFLRDPTLSPPTRPTALSSYFPWDRWVDVAKNLASGKPRLDEAYISIELLQAIDRNAEAAALLRTVSEKPQEYPVAVAYATKLLIPLLKACDDEMNLSDMTFLPVYRLNDP